MLLYIFFAFLAYILFRLVFNFIIPVYRTTKKVRKGFREMQEKMRQHAAGHTQQQSSGMQTEIKKNDPKPAGEYIDFEEVK